MNLTLSVALLYNFNMENKDLSRMAASEAGRALARRSSRTAKLPKEQRSEIARKAARALWLSRGLDKGHEPLESATVAAKLAAESFLEALGPISSAPHLYADDAGQAFVEWADMGVTVGFSPKGESIICLTEHAKEGAWTKDEYLLSYLLEHVGKLG